MMQQQYGSHGERGNFPTGLIAVVAVVIAAVVIFGLVMLFASGNGYYGYPGGYGMMGGFGGFSMFMFPVGLIVLFVIGYVLFRGFWWGGGCGTGYHETSYSHHDSSAETPIEILRKRYAKGEITKEQYEQMKRDLTT